MEIKFSDEVVKILDYSRDEALRTGHLAISVDQIMLGILRHESNRAVTILHELGVDTYEMKHYLDSKTFRKDPIPYADIEKAKFTDAAQSAIYYAHAESLVMKCHAIFSEHLLLAICRTKANATKTFLTSKRIGYDSVAGKLNEMERINMAGKARFPDFRILSGALSEQLGILMNRESNDPVAYS